jgi:tetratricopeptide (TPR) repeat protein
LEILAFGATAALFAAHLIDLRQALWILPSAVAAAGGLFIVASLVRPRMAAAPPAPKEASASLRQWQQPLKVGRKLLAEERYEDAARMFEEVLKLDADNWQACNYLGLAASRRGLYEEARAAYEHAVTLQPEFASAHFNLATALEKLDQPSLAMARWREYLTVGQNAHERADLLDHARGRVAALEKAINQKHVEEV